MYFDLNKITQATAAKCIHHPKGDAKQISSGEIKENIVSFQNRELKIVKWQDDNNGTKDGSSGAPIYRNDNRLIAATLTGSSNDCSPRDYTPLLRYFLYSPIGPINFTTDAGKALLNTSSETSTVSTVNGYDPIGDCQHTIHLNDRFYPAEIYRTVKPNITIQAENTIHIASQRRTVYESDVNIIGSKISNYKFQAGYQIKIHGDQGGFRIPIGHKGYFLIQECSTSSGCGINYFSKKETIENGEIIFPNHEEGELSNSISIYPNPSAKIIYILNAANSEFEIFNAFGAIIRRGNILGQKEIIDLVDLSSGVYFITFLINNHFTKTYKIIRL